MPLNNVLDLVNKIDLTFINYNKKVIKFFKTN